MNRSRYELAEYNYAIEHIHFPADKELLLPENAWCLMSFCSFLLSVRRLKEKRQDLKSKCDSAVAGVDNLLASLPMSLPAPRKGAGRGTEGSGKRSGHEPSGAGDVGSGKTIVAVLALWGPP